MLISFVLRLSGPRWATSSSGTSTDSRTYDEVPNEDLQVGHICLWMKMHTCVFLKFNLMFNCDVIRLEV